MATPTAIPRALHRVKPHHWLWILLGLLALSVLAFTEYPIFLGDDHYHARTRLVAKTMVLIPHVLGGVIATALGPFLFSTRFRQRHWKRHRVMGRVYVIAIAVAAPTAYLMGPSLGNAVGAFLWAACTFAAYQTARNRQIQAHQQWVIRSYLFTLNFVFTRVANPIPAWVKFTDANLDAVLITFHAAFLFVPDIYFNWRELTTKRKLAA